MERVKGFRDFYPDDMAVREKIFGECERWSRIFGFRKIDFPSVEYREIYKIKSGEELAQQSFSFNDKNGREIALLPEATPTVVRMLTARKDLPRPLKWYSIAKFWRYEEPQAGRFREFYQLNADIFGPDSAESDAEVIMLAMKILDSVGLETRYQIRINSREIMQGMLENLGCTNTGRALHIIDGMHKQELDRFRNEILELLPLGDDSRTFLGLLETPIEIEQVESIIGSSGKLFNGLEERIGRLIQTVKLCKKSSRSSIGIDFSVVRGLAYYTGVVFEAFDVDGEYRAILGGGRYDRLASSFTGDAIPAVGFGMGDAVIELVMKKYGEWSPGRSSTAFYLCRSADITIEETVDLVSKLRDNGMECIYDLSSRSLASQLKDASKNNCSFAIILGLNERKTGTLSVKNLTTGVQESVSISNSIDYLRNLRNAV